jgi:hypothetical protein
MKFAPISRSRLFKIAHSARFSAKRTAPAHPMALTLRPTGPWPCYHAASSRESRHEATRVHIAARRHGGRSTRSSADMRPSSLSQRTVTPPRRRQLLLRAITSSLPCTRTRRPILMQRSSPCLPDQADEVFGTDRGPIHRHDRGGGQPGGERCACGFGRARTNARCLRRQALGRHPPPDQRRA